MIGTYEVAHVASGRAYIGSSSDVPRRLAAHRDMLRRNAHTNAALQAAWLAEGEGAFAFRPLATCSLAEMREREAAELNARGWERVFNTESVVRPGCRGMNALFTDDQVRDIYQSAQAGTPNAVLAERYGVPRWTIRRIVVGDTYRDITGGVPARGPVYACGERVPLSKLTAATVLAIRQRMASGESGRAIAREVGVTAHALYLIRDGKTWRHVGGPIRS